MTSCWKNSEAAQQISFQLTCNRRRASSQHEQSLGTAGQQWRKSARGREGGMLNAAQERERWASRSKQANTASDRGGRFQKYPTQLKYCVLCLHGRRERGSKPLSSRARLDARDDADPQIPSNCHFGRVSPNGEQRSLRSGKSSSNGHCFTAALSSQHKARCCCDRPTYHLHSISQCFLI